MPLSFTSTEVSVVLTSAVLLGITNHYAVSLHRSTCSVTSCTSSTTRLIAPSYISQVGKVIKGLPQQVQSLVINGIIHFHLPVVLALERYRAVWHPIEYHNSLGAGQPWKRVMTYVGPAVLFAVLVNLPKFFEVKFVPFVSPETYYDNATGTYLTASRSDSGLKTWEQKGGVEQGVHKRSTVGSLGQHQRQTSIGC